MWGLLEATLGFAKRSCHPHIFGLSQPGAPMTATVCESARIPTIHRSGWKDQQLQSRLASPSCPGRGVRDPASLGTHRRGVFLVDPPIDFATPQHSGELQLFVKFLRIRGASPPTLAPSESELVTRVIARIPPRSHGVIESMPRMLKVYCRRYGILKILE